MKKFNVKESSVISHFYVLVKPEPCDDHPKYFYMFDEHGNLGVVPLFDYAYHFLTKRELNDCLRYLGSHFPNDKFVSMEVMASYKYTLPFECFLNNR